MKHLTVGTLLLLLASWLRLRGLEAAQVLGDGIGPWWVAWTGAPWLTPHAPPFGWLLYLPYAVIVQVSSSLEQALGGLQLLHAAVAPLAAFLAWRLHPSVSGALLAGLAAALSPGLIEVGLTGAQVHLAPLWIGLLALSVTVRPRPVLAGVALAAAVMNHPLAICAAPLLVLLPRQRRTLLGLGAGALLLAPHLIGLLDRPMPASGMVDATVGRALLAAAEEGATGALALLGIAAGLARTETRPLAAATAAGLLLLCGLGAGLSYLQPYHLRLLLLPALAGLAALPLPAILLGVFLRLPPTPQPVDGSLQVLHTISDAVLTQARWPVLIDHAWLSAQPVAEPAAVMLDLHLRGVPASALGVGGEVVLIVSAEPRDLRSLSGLQRLSERGGMRRGDAAELAAMIAPWCEHAMALGGAWDGLHYLDPQTRLEEVTLWWECAP